MLRLILMSLGIAFLLSCNNLKDKVSSKPSNIEFIVSPETQELVFNNLVKLADKTIASTQLDDSLAFLILPVKLSCPACRKKTIDSIVKHQNDLAPGHFIIISGSEGQKNMNSYFQEVDKEMPVMKGQLFLDTTNQAYKMKLLSENPVIYYAVNRKAFKKVSSIPATVRNDLREFFSGINNIDLTKNIR